MVIEDVTRIEPAFIEDSMPTELADLAMEIQADSKELGKGLPEASIRQLRTFVGIMNSYYSNLIEGHHTRPADIEKAIAEKNENERVPHIVEARVHVEVQDWINQFYFDGKLDDCVSSEFIRDIHLNFYKALPESLHIVQKEGHNDRYVDPGEFRKVEEDDVVIGKHHPPTSTRVAAFMEHFHTRYTMAAKSPINRVVSIAAAHHRFAYIHPFLDGNGRVGRLMSHAMCLKAGVGANGLWSISRGLARGLKGKEEYKIRLAAADLPRQGDRDGRGNLSMAALREFSEWFLAVMLDQIRFTSRMFDFERLNERMPVLAGDVIGAERAAKIVEAILRHGEVARGDIPYLIAGGSKPLTGRALQGDIRELIETGFLVSDTKKGPVRINFPIQFREKLFPNLFTDTVLQPPEPPALNLGR
tara:strand:+ start:357 stop:1604 length:1248 start_codon:yes stop_codon:yes gene_type:complete